MNIKPAHAKINSLDIYIDVHCEGEALQIYHDSVLGLT